MLKSLLKVVSYAGLFLTLIPSILVFADRVDLNTNKSFMLLGTVLWFGSSPFWMNKGKQGK
ncbi:hypothetical protein JW948_05360 [bacterium]|nr:hypothetical protein [bacterium]